LPDTVIGLLTGQFYSIIHTKTPAVSAATDPHLHRKEL